MALTALSRRGQLPTPNEVQLPTFGSCEVGRWELSVVLVVAALSAQGGAAQPQQQTQQPVFRTTTRLIVQTVTVKDKDGKVIEGLTAKDFTVTEDGQPQDIAFVEFQRMGGGTPAQAAARQQTRRRRLPPLPHPSPPRAGGNGQPRRTRHRDGHRCSAIRRHPLPGSPAAGVLLRRLGDVAAGSDSRLHERAEIHRHADDAGRSRRDHGVSGTARSR